MTTNKPVETLDLDSSKQMDKLMNEIKTRQMVVSEMFDHFFIIIVC